MPALKSLFRIVRLLLARPSKPSVETVQRVVFVDCSASLQSDALEIAYLRLLVRLIERMDECGVGGGDLPFLQARI